MLCLKRNLGVNPNPLVSKLADPPHFSTTSSSRSLYNSDKSLNLVLVPALVLDVVVEDVTDVVVAVIEGVVEVLSVRVVEEVDMLTALVIVDVGVVDRLVTEVVVEVV